MRNGTDARLPATRDPDSGKAVPQHTLFNVYGEMLMQICRDYPALPDPRTLKAHEIRFYYEGLRADLHAATKPRGNASAKKPMKRYQ